jgi:hypothetical protein
VIVVVSFIYGLRMYLVNTRLVVPGVQGEKGALEDDCDLTENKNFVVHRMIHLISNS